MKCFIFIVHQHCNGLRICRSAIPKGPVRRGWKDAWFLASFAGGGVGGCSCSFTHFFFWIPLFSQHQSKQNNLKNERKKKEEAQRERERSFGFWMEEKWVVEKRQKIYIYRDGMFFVFLVIRFIIYWGGTGWMTVSSNDDDESCDWILAPLNV